MPKYPIDLGKKMGESHMSIPSSPSKEDKNKKFYPSLYLEWDKKYDFPDSGTMTVKFRKSSESNSKRTGEKTQQTVTLDIMEITDTKAGKGSEPEEESGSDALDRAKKEVESEKEESEDYD